MTLYRAYADAEREWVSTDQRLRRLVDQAKRSEAELYIDRLAKIEDNLRSYLALINERELLLPYVRPELARLKPADETHAGEQDDR